MRSTDDNGITARDDAGRLLAEGAIPFGARVARHGPPRPDPALGTLRFLIEQQIRVIDDLDHRGLDGCAAHDLLRRLMRRDEELRGGPAPAGALRVA